MNLNHITIEKKWQEEWRKNNLSESEISKNKKKFFVINAYPAISGLLHVGHIRGYAYADILARYKRMTGHNVLFPTGFHSSGLPTIAFARNVQKRKKEWKEHLKNAGISTKKPDFSTVEAIIKFFSEIYIDNWKKLGLLFDERRLLYTTDQAYSKFIEWQFRKLMQKGFLTKKSSYSPYCPNCGPVAVDFSEMDLSKGGHAKMKKFPILKFRLEDGKVLPVATPNQNTVLEDTNVWINPRRDYIRAKVKNETWLLSELGFTKLKNQNFKIKRLGKIKGKKLVGLFCKNPLLKKTIRVLPNRFVDPKVLLGTDLPDKQQEIFCWMALLEEIKKQEKNKKSKRAVSKNLKEMKKLCESKLNSFKKTNKKITYRPKQSAYGKMEQEFLYDFTESVTCRCGQNVFVKLLPEQWFIDYENKKLKNKTIKWLKQMIVYPQSFKQSFPRIISSYKSRVCIRKGSWLGTRFPFKKKWVIEPGSDSTLYPIFYIISKYINQCQIKNKQLVDAFFDFVFGEKNNLKEAAKKTKMMPRKLLQIKKEVNYWYPLDLNIAGKEHETVHFPVFLTNHIAVLNKRHWPKGVFATGWVVKEKIEETDTTSKAGKKLSPDQIKLNKEKLYLKWGWWFSPETTAKLSKSKGGTESIPKIIQKYSADALRLYYSHIDEPYADIIWDPKSVLKYKRQINQIAKEITKLTKTKNTPRNLKRRRQELPNPNSKIRKATKCLDKYDLRGATQIIYFDLLKDLQNHRKKGVNPKSARKFIEKWIKCMAIFTPHMAEELWRKTGNKKMVTIEKWPA